MKKLLMVICVLSLLGLLAAPVLAEAFAGPDSVIGPEPILPGGHRLAGVEDPVQIAWGGFRSPAPLG